MALPDSLLTPIPGDNSSGENLRYAPVYDKIKEARREDDVLPQGDWAHEVKRADWVVVQKQAQEVLEKKSKDLQLAAWLTEALLHREGFQGLNDGLTLLRGLLENFWDTLYPEIEDGDLELRAAPLDWVGTYLETQVRKTPLTKSGYNWFQQKESRTVGYEAEVAGNEEKAAARQVKIDEGKLTPEMWDADVELTKLETVEKIATGLEQSLESLQQLQTVSDQKFGRDAPGYGKLRTALEEVQRLVQPILKKKQPVEEVAEEAAAEEVVEEAAEGAAEGEAGARPRARRTLSAEPVDRDDAVARVGGVARFWRGLEPYSPVPYLLLRALRWGELRAGGAQPDPSLLEAPPTEVRQNIKQLALNASWAEVLEAAENAVALPCGRAWLDVQRYVVRACTELGTDYEPIANAVRAALRGLLADYPALPSWTLMDDTPTANPETQAWLNTLGTSNVSGLSAESLLASPGEEAGGGSGEEKPPDVQQLALQAMKEGRPNDAVDLLSRAAAQERSGRARFQRLAQLAGVCLSTGCEHVALPILQGLAAELERRQLEDWEDRELLAQPLALLYQCLGRLKADEAERQAIYNRLCRLDPAQAMKLSS